MKHFFKIFLSFCLLLLTTCSLKLEAVHAAGDFIVNYNVNYAVSDQGVTTVNQDVSLINEQTNLYAKEYSILIDSTRIENVTASDSKGPIIPTTQNKDGKTQIHLLFNDQVVGQGKILHFTLQYQDDNIAKRNGTIWEITIPGVADDKDLGDYTVHLAVPPSFGSAAYVVPVPKKQYTWSKDQLINGGVNAAFGQNQTFELSLSYYIENTKSQSIVTEVALPPSTAFQKVILESITPEPQEIVPDADGNWLARYKLSPGTNQVIQATVLVQLTLQPRASYPLNENEQQQYLQSTNYWNTNDSHIKELAQKYKTPRDIYNYVVSTLSYDYSRVNQNISRKGAVAALETPKNSVCMEFTDVFVAIARAAGIPARQAVGYAYTTNSKLRPLSLVSDVLHAWPEYYDVAKQTWIPVDPTWANTTGGVDYFDKLDFNHIVFAYNGIRDDYPYPAGFYRQSGHTGKDVEVRFYDQVVPEENATLATELDVPTQIPAGWQQNGSIIIKNTARVSAENVLISLEGSSFGLHQTLSNQIIPPYGTLTIPVSLQSTNWGTFGATTIATTVNGELVTKSITIIPPYQIIAPILIFAVWIIITVLFFTKKFRLWKHSKKK